MQVTTTKTHTPGAPKIAATAGFKALTASQQYSAISKMMNTAAGRTKIGNSMQQPLRELRDYKAIGRNLLLVDDLPQGVEAYYDKDVDTPAFVAGEEGEDIIVRQRGDRVHVDLFEVATYIAIPMTQLRQRRYDINARVKTKVRSDIVKVEDQRVFDLVERVVSHASAANPVFDVDKATASLDLFSTGVSLIERHGDIACKGIWMNAINNDILRTIHKDFYVDFTTSETLMDQGKLARLFNAQIYNSSVIPENMIYFTAEPEFVGRFVIGQDIKVLNADSPKERTVGYSVFEQIGLLISNSKAISACRLV